MAKKKITPSPKTTVKEIDQTINLKNSIVEGMQEKKAHEIVTLDLTDIENTIASYFIICHAESKPHVQAIADSVLEMAYKLTGQEPAHKEGIENAEWILLDYFDIIVHIFIKEKREFFKLERLWGDAHIQTMAGNY
ncbi:MAG: ribosome silencing factor [Bacteroidia bacterium]